MNVTLEDVTTENLQVLGNLAILFRYDLQPYFPDHPVCQLNEYGTFDDKRSHDQVAATWDVFIKPGVIFPYLIHCEGQLAGFATVCRPPHCCPSVHFRMNDFFIINKFWRKGVGRRAAFRLFERHKGLWEVEYGKHNLPAVGFWRSVVSEFTERWEDWDEEGHLDPRMEALKFDTTTSRK